MAGRESDALTKVYGTYDQYEFAIPFSRMAPCWSAFLSLLASDPSFTDDFLVAMCVPDCLPAPPADCHLALAGLSHLVRGRAGRRADCPDTCRAHGCGGRAVRFVREESAFLSMSYGEPQLYINFDNYDAHRSDRGE